MFIYGCFQDTTLYDPSVYDLLTTSFAFAREKRQMKKKVNILPVDTAEVVRGAHRMDMLLGLKMGF